MESEEESREEFQADENENTERQHIKEQLSTLTFEELQKLKEEMGTKLYNERRFGEKKNNKPKTFKRANKNRPREMSSKKPVNLEQKNILPAKKQIVRDPRFEPICGIFDRKTFKSNYKFVNDIRRTEKKQLEKQLHETTDKEEKKKIKFLLQRLENQIREEEKRDSQETSIYKEKEENRVKEKPYFKKKSVKKLESLIDKYEELKKTNKIQKHIERKSKKVSARERKRLEKHKLI